MIFNSILFVSGLALLYYGAEYLIKTGKSIAKAFGIPAMLIGITIIAFGTSLPELIVSILANFRHQEGIVLGNIIGSNIANIGLVLGVAALISPIKFEFSRSSFDLYFLLAVTVLYSFLLHFGKLSIIHGLLFLAILIAYCYRLYRSGKSSYKIDDEPLSTRVIFLFLAGIAGLWLGSHMFVTSAVGFAELLHVPTVAIGMTVVALGTSVPELATSIVAAAHKESDIAVGNVIGSNVFNILAVMGSSLLVRPITFSFSVISANVYIMLFFAAAILLLIRYRNGISRVFGLVFFILYLVSCIIMFT